jgi:hypothetical protein
MQVLEKPASRARELTEQHRDDIEARLEVMKNLVTRNITTVQEFIALPLETRRALVKRKPDGTLITPIDLENDERSRRIFLGKFPGDSFGGEEIQTLERWSQFILLQDPIDGTDHAVNFDPRHPVKKRWATVMQTLLCNGIPVAFALGVALRNEVYWGTAEGAFFDGHAHVPDRSSSDLLVWINEDEHGPELEKIIGYQNIKLAGVCAWTILQGMTTGGACPFPLVHESACIGAIAESMGATVTNMHGEVFQPSNEQDGLVWTFGKHNIKEIADRARKLRR